MLFQPYQRTYTEHQKRGMSIYEFMDKSAWPIAEFMREHMNAWSLNFLDDAEFVARFKSKNRQHHYSASFELLVQALLTSNAFLLDKHPFTGTSRRLDFLAQHSNQQKYYLECTLSGNSFEDSTERNQKEAIEEIIDDIEYFPYFINLDYTTLSPRSISKKRLLRFLNELKAKSEGIPNEVLLDNPVLFEDNGWQIEFSLSRKTNSSIKRSLGFQMNSARTIDTSKPVLSALLDKKPSSYGITSLPYLICLHSSDLFTRHETYLETLLGLYGPSPINISHHTQNSFFLVRGKPINTSVSAVIIFRNFDPFTLDHSTIAIYHNPFAKVPIPINEFPFPEYSFDKIDDELHLRSHDKDADVFDLLKIDREAYKSNKSKHND